MIYVFLSLLILAMGLIECLIGGTRLLFSIPSYSILAIGSFLTLFSIRKIRVAPRFWCLISSAVFFGYILFRAAHSPVDYLARPDYYMVLGCLMVYLLTAFYLTTTRSRIIFVLFLLAMALVHIWVGIIQFTQVNEYMLLPFIMRAKSGYRASGLYISPNHYAGYLETVAILALSLAWWGRLKAWLKLLLVYLTICCYVGIAISASRGSYYSSVVSLVAFSVLSLRVVRVLSPERFLRMALGMAFGVVAIVGVAFFLMLHSPDLQARMRQMANKDIRIYNWQATMDQIRLSPLVGTGAGTHLIYGRKFRRPQLQADPVHSHCDYLELVAEYGAVGGAGMLLFLWFHISNGIKSSNWVVRRRLLYRGEGQSDTLALNIGCLSAIAGLAAHSVVDFNMHIPGNALMFAFIFGIMANPGIEKFVETGIYPTLAGLFRIALPVLGAWVIYSALPKLPPEYFSEQARVALRDKDFSGTLSGAEKAMGGQIAPEEMGWPEKALVYFGGEKHNPDLYFYCGEANRVIGLSFRGSPFMARLESVHLEKAIAFYRQGLLIFPQDEHMLVRMAQSLDGLKKYNEADETFKKAIDLDPNLGVIYGYYGAHLKAMGKLAESKAAYEKGQHLASESIQDLGQIELGLQENAEILKN